MLLKLWHRDNSSASSPRKMLSRRSSIAETLVTPLSRTSSKLELSPNPSRKQSFTTQAVGIRWRGVIAMVAGVCQQTLCWGMIMTFGTILSFYVRHLMPKTSKMELSLIGGLQPFFVLALSLLWGRLLDAGHHRYVNGIAAICLTGGLVSLAHTGGSGRYGDGKYWQVLLASLPIGVGQSAYFLAAPHMAKSWYPKRKGLAMGVTNSGAAIGGTVWPIIFTEVTSQCSFKVGIATLAGISGVLGIFITYASIPGPTFEPRAVDQIATIRTWIPTRAFRSRTFIVHIVAMCFIYLGILTIPFFIEYWAQQNGIGLSEDTRGGLGINDKEGPLTVYLVVIMNACQLPGRLLGSMLCDYIRARKIHFTACLLAVALILPSWLLMKTYAAGCSFAAFFGLTLGIMASLPINDTQDILGTQRTRLLGQYAGVVYTIASPFVLAGAIISGAIVDNFHNHAAGIWAASTLAVGAIFILLSLSLEDDTWKFDDIVESKSSEVNANSNKSVTIAEKKVNRSNTQSRDCEQGVCMA